LQNQELLDDKYALWCLSLEFYVIVLAGMLDFIGQAPNSDYFYYHFLFCSI